MKTVYKELLLLIALVALLSSVSLGQITTTGSGNWSSTTPDAPWPGGVVPGAADNVVIADGHTVTIDTNVAVCNNLTIGTSGVSNTTVRWRIDGLIGVLTVNGDIVLAFPNSRLRAEGRVPSGDPNTFVEHSLNLYGNLNNSAGGTIDFRAGSNSGGTSNGVLLSLLGTSNSTITLSRTMYGSSNEEFNSITVNKTGGAKVLLAAGNLFMSNNSSVGGTFLTLTEGLIQTGSNHWVHLRTGSASIVGGSNTSYVHGILGRGISNGGGLVTVDFHVGDSAQYRPVNVRLSAPTNATGHYVWATVHNGDANTGSSTFNGEIDKVSEVRYYEIGYLQNAGTSATMDFYGFGPSYGDDDGVSAGNMDLRAAYSADSGSTWTDHGPTNDTTDLANPPTLILGDSLTSNLTVNTGNSILVALARATGTTTNTLEAPVSSVEKISDFIPRSFEVSQNFPNPFNPSTTIHFSLKNAGDVVLKVYDIAGREVAELVNDRFAAGTYQVQWDAAGLASGAYFYSISVAGVHETKRMVLLK